MRLWLACGLLSKGTIIEGFVGAQHTLNLDQAPARATNCSIAGNRICLKGYDFAYIQERTLGVGQTERKRICRKIEQKPTFFY